jgi:hypothetical protein
MKIVDACAVAPSGFLCLLTDDGSVLMQERVNNVAYQNVPPSLRPEFTWRRIAGPEAAVFTRILAKGQDILVLADDILWERVRDRTDPTDMHIPAWIWRRVALPDDDTLAPVTVPPAAAFPGDTHDHRKRETQTETELRAENAALRKVIDELTSKRKVQ